MMAYHLTLKDTTPASDFLAFLVSTMTWYKTFLYFLIDFFSGWQSSGHNKPFDFYMWGGEAHEFSVRGQTFG